MSFFAAVMSCFSNYFNFSDRAVRSEYWFFQLFCIILAVLASMVDAADPTGAENVSKLCGLITFIPSLTVTVRRLHDVNRSGWWIFINFTIIGIIPFFWWMIKRSNDGANKYGL